MAAASIAGAYAMARPPLGLWPSWKELTADYRTATGEQRVLALAANVSVRMNTQTSIVVQPSDENTDSVALVAGEASFATGGDGARRFVVLAGERRIEAKVAKFDVRYMPGRNAAPLCVTCISGQLKVVSGTNVTTLEPGQQFRRDGNGQQEIVDVDPEVASAWQQGILIFRATPLADVVEEVNRYRPGRIIVINDEIARMPVSGRFRVARLDEILVRIEQAVGAKILSLPGGLVVLS
ncbi:FecR family protein [Hyphomicrobium album]|uniref:FecR family protein n=1 Tax=Hyphomicrobium album TaxID=2665159 RepID=UPI001E44A766|nr:FecR domain-containing protein [Hyphomicrobium album]